MVQSVKKTHSKKRVSFAKKLVRTYGTKSKQVGRPKSTPKKKK